MADTRALVVGAGIAGLATARTLARADITVEVIERAATWEEVGTGMYLPANAARALCAVDLDRAGLIERSKSRASASATIGAGCSSTSTCRGLG